MKGRCLMLYKINNYSLRTKFMILIIFCLIIPVLSLELVVAYFVILKENKDCWIEREDIIDRTMVYINHSIDELKNFSNYVCMDDQTYDFIYTKYEDDKEYLRNYAEFTHHSVTKFDDIIARMKELAIYTNNPTVLEGSSIHQLDSIRTEEWYKDFCEANTNQIIYCNIKNYPEISVITDLNYYSKGKEWNREVSDYEGIVKADLDVRAIDYYIASMQVHQSIYICYKETILSSNTGNEVLLQPFQEIEKQSRSYVITSEVIPDYQDFKIYVVTDRTSFFKETVFQNKVILLALILNLVVPVYLVSVIERSMMNRILLLENRFDWHINEEMRLIEGNYGKDEIGRLIEHYNSYVKRVMGLAALIQKRNEENTALELSKKQAEINALVSQANPHFLYNSIESICMRSVIKQEHETATIMRHLSLLLRDMSTWKTDRKTLLDEIEFAKRYMEIQRYRFGEKISYEVEVEKECESIIIPKLSVITFVENACVHGIENSLNDGKIRIQAKREGTWYVIRIEDNGAGMSEVQKELILRQVQTANLETFQTSTSTGILNANLRLQLFYGDHYNFDIKSTEDQGTTVILRIRVDEVV